MLIAAMLLLAAGAPLASAVSSAPVATVPAEIDRHYRDYNFVNAFSTRDERTMIAAGRAPSEPRLGRIARAMRRIAERIDDIDPGMVMGGGRASPETAMRADLVRIASWQTGKNGEEAWVTLDVSTLDRGTNVILVGKFDEVAGSESLPSIDAILGATPSRGPEIHTTEVHHWIRTDGTWRRAAATLHFLAN
ncbi:MAG TPA: hypothetical protein VFT38_21375 [Vicinamibacteria bacterium]|nr:hypothetical protein [Vicinamibacteria bacterium]